MAPSRPLVHTGTHESTPALGGTRLIARPHGSSDSHGQCNRCKLCMLHSHTIVVIAPGLRTPEVSLLRSMYHGLTDSDTLFAPCSTRTVCMSDPLQHGLHHLCQTVARHVPSICRVVVVLHISWCRSQRHRASSMHHAVIDVV